jgi:hypothetical protein
MEVIYFSILHEKWNKQHPYVGTHEQVLAMSNWKFQSLRMDKASPKLRVVYCQHY